MVATSPPGPALSTGAATSPRRFTIYFEDDALRQRSEQTMQSLLTAALDKQSTGKTTSNAALLARKALKYRRVLDRAAVVDVTSPLFDASKFMGVDWCHTPSLKAHCARRQ